MEKKNIKQNEEKEIRIDNYKITNKIKTVGTLKFEKNDSTLCNKIIIKEMDESFTTDVKKDDNCENNFEKRESTNFNISENVIENIADTNLSNKQETTKDDGSITDEKKINDLQKEIKTAITSNENKVEIKITKEKNVKTSFNKNKNETNDTTNKKEDLRKYYEKLPTVIIVIGMAGSGKTTYVGALYNYLKKECKKKVYAINLDPAVKHLHYTANIDIRDSIKYHEVMKQYKLGPNGAIMTCLNLFATRFDKVIEILEKRKNKLNYIIVDTPGQIEVFNWSASGNIILETLSVSFPVVINYIVDTVRCERPITFMSNMLYACSVLYKTRLPFLACFNKIDVIKHDKCIEWMKNYDTFSDDVLNDESYMASFSRSCALMINEFYEGIKTIGVSSKTNEGFNNILKKLEYLKEEFIIDYVSIIDKQMKKIKKRKDKDIKLKMESLLIEQQKNISNLNK
ncbi:XPA binding protein 1, putative [Hepatocystis sp. ex Piliocolobus tephrosceles]|uniref:GPN-loop GTPase 1 n=1 Tax=Piliocolobus tephrosceles TaxID=591936 RepID=A0A8C9H6J8_9PRIM|nr:XPA binding protein 1, putative [Hepatocystis sp. ex Piliocolobus tephrosceles]